MSLLARLEGYLRKLAPETKLPELEKISVQTKLSDMYTVCSFNTCAFSRNIAPADLEEDIMAD